MIPYQAVFYLPWSSFRYHAAGVVDALSRANHMRIMKVLVYTSQQEGLCRHDMFSYTMTESITIADAEYPHLGPVRLSSP